MSAADVLRNLPDMPDHSGEEAVLNISGWYSWCGACRGQVLPESLTHEKVSGYGPAREGCHALFTSVASDYGDVEACRRIRPDLPLAAAFGVCSSTRPQGGVMKRFYPSGLEAPLFGPVTDDEVIREALEYAHEMMLRRDEMNAAVHCQSLRLSPVTRMAARALALQYVRMGVLADVAAVSPEVSGDE